MRIRSLGGTTGHWNGWCRPLMPQDFERRDYIPDSGWPLKYLESRALVPQGVPDARDRGVRVGRGRAIGADVEAPAARLVEHRAALLPVQSADPLQHRLRPGAGTGRGRPRRHLRQPRRHPSGSDPRARRGLRVPDAGGDDLPGERRALRARAGWGRERPCAPGVQVAAARGRGQRPRRSRPLLHGASALLRLDRRRACVGARLVVLPARRLGLEASRRHARADAGRTRALRSGVAAREAAQFLGHVPAGAAAPTPRRPRATRCRRRRRRRS